MPHTVATVRRVRLAGLVLAAVALVVSCDQATAPNSEGRPEALAPSLDLTSPGPAPGTLSGSLSPQWSNVGVGPVAIGTLAETTYVEITTTSGVHKYWADHAWLSYPGADLGMIGAGSTYSSTYGCWNSIYYRSDFLSAQISPCPTAYGAGAELTQKKKGTVYGAITAHWSPKGFYSVGFCDGNGYACYRYTGSYSITIIPSFDKLRLTASASDVSAGDSVRFTASTSNNSAFTVKEWIWVPDTATNPQTGTCAAGIKICTVNVFESGTMYVRAKVGAKVEQVGQYVYVGPQEVRITSDAGFTTRPASAGMGLAASRIPLRVGVFSGRGVAIPNRTVSLSLAGQANEGGHLHGGTVPTGALASTSVATGTTGTATVNYTASIFSGKVIVSGTSAGATGAAETITIRIPDLVELIESAAIERVGVTASHPSSHWGQQGMVDRLREAGARFSAKYSIPLRVNDMSLTSGGKFEVAGTYGNGSHAEHQIGTSADIRTHGATPLTPAQMRFLYDLWVAELGGEVLDETGTAQPHYHFRY